MLLDNRSARRTAVSVALHTFIRRDLDSEPAHGRIVGHEQRPLRFILRIDRHRIRYFDSSGRPRARRRRVLWWSFALPHPDETHASDLEIALLALKGESRQRCKQAA